MSRVLRIRVRADFDLDELVDYIAAATSAPHSGFGIGFKRP